VHLNYFVCTVTQDREHLTFLELTVSFLQLGAPNK